MRSDESARWPAQARWDLKAARDSAAAGNFEWSCFQAQQAAEKALRSFLYSAGAEPGALHSLRRLIAECETVRPEFASLRKAAELDRYCIPTRYPNGLPGDVPHEYYTAEAAEECLSLVMLLSSVVCQHAPDEHVEGSVSHFLCCPTAGNTRSAVSVIRDRVRREIERELSEWVPRIVEAMRPEKIILFGSAARGEAGESSDIDLAVIADSEANFFDRIGQVMDLYRGEREINVLAYTPAEWQQLLAKGRRFIATIAAEGVVLYARESA